MSSPKIKNRCSIPGCERKYDSHGYCGMHRLRFRRYGNPHHVVTEEERRLLCRIHQPKLNQVQPHVYKKFLGKHIHRRVMEEKIGRLLTKWEIVHHIDGDKHNNHPDNLQLITSKEHIKIHRQEMMFAAQQRKAEKKAMQCS